MKARKMRPWRRKEKREKNSINKGNGEDRLRKGAKYG